MTLQPADEAFLAVLADRIGADALNTPGPAYLEEPRGRYAGHAATLLKPRTTDDVAAIVGLCADHRVGVIPYAGGTGLVGGQTFSDGPAPVLISVERLNRVRDICAEDNVITAEAGVVLADVQTAAADVGRLFPLSLASEGSARIGGTLATNAGGVNVLRYGNARDLCLGVEAVLPDGRVLHGLKLLRKDNTGYDLRHLLVGSEGTLGIITAASLKLFPRPAAHWVALAAVDGPRASITLLNRLRDQIGEAVSAFEIMHRQGLDFLAETLPDTPQPFAEIPQWSVLIDIGAAAGTGMQTAAEAVLERAFDDGLISDALVAQNEAQARSFWTIRETIPEANRLIGSVSSHDISVPISDIQAFIDTCGPRLLALDDSLRINCFGHLGDGNLHYNVFPQKGRNRSDYENLRPLIKDTVHDLAHALGGSVSAEHGIGRLKVDDLETYGDPVKLAAMRAIKTALDPQGIMNPGAVLK